MLAHPHLFASAVVRWMPSSLHECLIELFRADLHLIETLAAPALGIPPGGLGALHAIDATLTDPRPVERRADLAILSEHGPAFILEVQLAVDPDKRWTWPSYAALTRDRLRRDVVLVVLTLQPAVAAWARTPIRLDPMGSALRPLVIGPQEIPLITDPAQACAHPEQLVLAAIAHGQGPQGVAIAGVAATAIRQLDDDRARTYTDLILNALGTAARAALEAALFENYEYQSELFRKLVSQGRQEGRQEAATLILLDILRHRHIAISDAARTQIAAAPSAETLQRYITRALTASSLDEVLID